MKRILPAYPLWVIDPNFSVWSPGDELNGCDTTFWTGLSRRAYGFVRANGKTYCFLGRKSGAQALRQTAVSITAFGTEYTFEGEGFTLKVDFISPLPPDDLKRLSCPVCYTEYEVRFGGEVPSDFSVAIALDEEFCYNEDRAKVVGGVLPLEGYEAAFMTRARNLLMSNADDIVAPDWGDIYLAGDESFFITDTALNHYVAEGRAEYVRKDHERSYLLALSRAPKGYFMTAFDDKVSIFYFGEWLKGYYFKDGKTIVDAMNESRKAHGEVLAQCARFDEVLRADCEKVGEGYYTLACAALRQSVGAHKLVENGKGELLFLSKECDSNGCIGTADVSYPSIPLYLIYNPELVNAMLTGIFTFAKMPVWTYDFAPHDIGTYPWCIGQVYSVRNADDKYSCNMTCFWDYPRTHTMLYLRPAASSVYTDEYQMPVEECGNMLVMAAAAILAGASARLAKANFRLLRKWVKYLEKYGLKPSNQLCTDDFAGHLADNVNLAIKALAGIEAFSVICGKLGKDDLAAEYKARAEKFAFALKKLVGNGIMPLAYGKEGSYSLKYNILFDKLSGFCLIGQDVCERETAYYIQKNERCGVPLDTRKSYTKADWILWAAALTDDKEKACALYEPVLVYLAETPSRNPFGDWYDAKTGIIEHFFNRTVVGGIFAPLLKEKNILNGGKV